MNEICQSMRRLYAAASQLAKVSPKPAPVARLLNEITQTVKNWESRGVPDHAAIKAQRIMGVDATWIKEDEPGDDLPVKTISETVVTHAVAERLPAPYIHPDALVRQVVSIMENTDHTGKSMILMSAQQALERYHPAKQTVR